MARFWRLLGHWRTDGYRYIHHPEVFHLHFLPHHGLSRDHLFLRGFLDEREAVYSQCEEKSVAVSLIGLK